VNAILISETEESLASAAAQRFIQLASQSIKKTGKFTVALSGGRGPQGMFRELLKRSESVDWRVIEIFWVDERWIGFEDEQSNCGNARRLLLDALSPPPTKIFPMFIPGESPEKAAEVYERRLRGRFGAEGPFFDLCLLGMGADGHTASLFPKQEAALEQNHLCLAVKHPETGQERLTLTLPVINACRHVLFLLSGAEKSATLSAVLRGEATFPAALVKPKFNDLEWMVSQDAANRNS
jgi:6-phosphogluconolactonase